MMAGPDLKAIHAVQMAIQSSILGPALVPAYSFYSITEVSEYVPDAEEYGRILREREHVDPESSMYKAKVAAYAERLEPMNRQRLYSRLPGLALPLLLPDEQDAERRPELVSAAVRGAVRADGPARPQRDEVRRPRRARSSPPRPAWTTGSGASRSGPATRSISRTSSTRCGSMRARPGTPSSATSTSATSSRRGSSSRPSGCECPGTDRRERPRDLVLASTSPYRRALLSRLGVPFRCVAPRFDESSLDRGDRSPRAVAEALALGKAASIAAVEPAATIIGCDQLVALEGRILGKPGRAEQRDRAARGDVGTGSRADHRPGGAPGRGRHRPHRRHGPEDAAAGRGTRSPATWPGISPSTARAATSSSRRGSRCSRRIETEDHTAITGLPLIRLTTILRTLGFAVP